MLTNSEMIRIRRQMHRRIRDVVAERRMARQGAVPRAGDNAETRSGPVEPSDTCADRSLIAGRAAA